MYPLFTYIDFSVRVDVHQGSAWSSLLLVLFNNARINGRYAYNADVPRCMMFNFVEFESNQELKPVNKLEE